MRSLRVVFHIIDREIETEYDYESLFLKDSEFIMFMQENLAVGNTVTVLSIEEETADLAVLKEKYFNHF